jgi:hypothetical protein
MTRRLRARVRVLLSTSRCICLLLLGPLLCALLAPGTAFAQQAAFPLGELYMVTSGYPDVGNALVHIDPTTGDHDLVTDLSAFTAIVPTLTWDPFRNRLLSAVQTGSPNGGIVSIDAFGYLRSPYPSEPTPTLLASRGDGIVYLWRLSSGTVRYIDAADTVHDLLDVSGTGIFTLSGLVTEMIYDPGTDSLLMFQQGQNATATCPAAAETCAIKVPLTASGTQVAGALSAAQYDVSTSSEVPVGSGYLPGGDVLVVVDTNNNTEEARMLVLDPGSMTLSPFASNGPYTGAAATRAGTYSQVRDQALILDSYNDFLRAYSLSDVGGGTPLGSGLSEAGSGDLARLVEIHTSATVAVPGLGPVGGLLLVVTAALATPWALRRRGGLRPGSRAAP